MTDQNNEHGKVFHSMAQLKGELFPNMSEEPWSDSAIAPTDEVDEAESLAEKLIHDLMHKSPAREA